LGAVFVREVRELFAGDARFDDPCLFSVRWFSCASEAEAGYMTVDVIVCSLVSRRSVSALRITESMAMQSRQSRCSPLRICVCLCSHHVGGFYDNCECKFMKMQQN
jgi:hypothetical protein